MTVAEDTATPDRYTSHGFGATAASNSTCLCRECGVVVYLKQAHDDWHERMEARRG